MKGLLVLFILHGSIALSYECFNSDVLCTKSGNQCETLNLSVSASNKIYKKNCPKWIKNKNMPTCPEGEKFQLSEDYPTAGYVIGDQTGGVSGSKQSDNSVYVISTIRKLMSGDTDKPPMFHTAVSDETWNELKKSFTRKELKRIRRLNLPPNIGGYDYMRDLLVPSYDNGELSINFRSLGDNVDTDMKGFEVSGESLNCGVGNVKPVKKDLGDGGEYVGLPFGGCVISETTVDNNKPTFCKEEDTIVAPTGGFPAGHTDEVVAIAPNPSGKEGCKFSVFFPDFYKGDEMLEELAKNYPDKPFISKKTGQEMHSRGKRILSSGKAPVTQKLACKASMIPSNQSRYGAKDALNRLDLSLTKINKMSDSELNSLKLKYKKLNNESHDLKQNLDQGAGTVFPESLDELIGYKIATIEAGLKRLIGKKSNTEYVEKSRKNLLKKIDEFKKRKLISDETNSFVDKYLREPITPVVVKKRGGSRASSISSSKTSLLVNPNLFYNDLDCNKFTNEQIYSGYRHHTYQGIKKSWETQKKVVDFKKKVLEKIIEKSNGKCTLDDINVVDIPYSNITANPVNFLKTNSGKLLVPTLGNPEMEEYLERHFKEGNHEIDFLNTLGKNSGGGNAHCTVFSYSICK